MRQVGRASRKDKTIQCLVMLLNMASILINVCKESSILRSRADKGELPVAATSCPCGCDRPPPPDGHLLPAGQVGADCPMAGSGLGQVGVVEISNHSIVQDVIQGYSGAFLWTEPFSVHQILKYSRPVVELETPLSHPVRCKEVEQLLYQTGALGLYRTGFRSKT